MKPILLSFTFLFIFSSLSANAKKKKVTYPNYLSVRALLPISLFEWEAIYSMGMQLKYNRIGIELEYGRIIGLHSYSQSGPQFEDKTKGNRTRLNIKYYFHSFTFKHNGNYHLYTSVMPSFKNVNYKMIWWAYDSLTSNNTYSYAVSHIPVQYNSKTLCLNLLLGNEFFISILNVDFYIGAGLKFHNVTIPDSTPTYFEPYSFPRQDGTYFNFLAGAKVGFGYRIKKRRLSNASR